jgi:hypothetical protein
MWVGEVSSAELFAANRWSVSFFADVKASSSSAFVMRPLSEIASERKGSTDPQQLGDVAIAFLGLENVRPLTGELVDFAKRPASSVKSRSKNFLAGDVLYGRLRPELNKVYLAEGPVSEGLCSGEFIVLTCQKGVVLPRYLRHILASPFVTRYAEKFKVGASLPRMGTSDLLGIEVPVPPLEVQAAMAQRLEALDQEVIALRTRLDSLPRLQSQALLTAIAEGADALAI